MKIYDDKKTRCKVCGKATDNTVYIIKEMLNNTKEEFEYLECPHCKSMQIIDIPEDMSGYYNQNYYSMKDKGKLTKFFLYHLNMHYLKKDAIGTHLSYLIDNNEELFNMISCLLEKNKISYSSEILDIGCGSGSFLEELSELGFKNLNGMEPFIDEEISKKEFTIFKDFLGNFNPSKKYDLIFMKDSLEHMDNPYNNLSNAKKLLKEDGYMIITIPIKSEFFWRLYGTNWYQLDAPRHFITFTLDGFKLLIKSLDLEIENISFNSNAYAFIISEEYSNDNPTYSKESFASRSHFKNIYNRKFKKINFQGENVSFNYLNKKIKDLNEKQEAEHAIFLIRKSSK